MSSSTTSPGGTRPPRPISVGAIIVPLPSFSAVAPLICVVERFAAPARNSVTRPDSVTAVPGTSAGSGGGNSGGLPVKTKMPSEVRASLSGRGSWTK